MKKIASIVGIAGLLASSLIWFGLAQVTGGGGLVYNTFLLMLDTPVSYAAGGGAFVQVNAGETNLQFILPGIADTLPVIVDGTAGDPADDEYARFTADGLEGRTEAEFKGDFNLEIGTDAQAYDADLTELSDGSIIQHLYVDAGAMVPQDISGDAGTAEALFGTIGAGYTGGLNFEGQMGECAVFDRALSSGERVQMEVYLQAKWATPALP